MQCKRAFSPERKNALFFKELYVLALVEQIADSET